MNKIASVGNLETEMKWLIISVIYQRMLKYFKLSLLFIYLFTYLFDVFLGNSAFYYHINLKKEIFMQNIDTISK